MIKTFTQSMFIIRHIEMGEKYIFTRCGIPFLCIDITNVIFAIFLLYLHLSYMYEALIYIRIIH